MTKMIFINNKKKEKKNQEWACKSEVCFSY